MNKVYSALQLQELYRLATAQMRLNDGELADRGAVPFVNTFNQLYRNPQQIHIFAGPEANGAYALAIARLLHECGRSVRIYLFYRQGRLGALCSLQHQRLLGMSVPIVEVTSRFEAPEFHSADVIIDGLFGEEITRPLEGGFAALVSLLNDSGLDIVSIELPSGLFPDSNQALGEQAIVRAKHTLTFETPRLAMFMAENAPYLGQWRVLPLGIPEQIHEQIRCQHFQESEQALSRSMRLRDPFADLEEYGDALLIGGASGRYGHLALAARACNISGCGQTYVQTQADGMLPMQIATPETTVFAEQADRRYQAIGVGIATTPELYSADMLRNLLARHRAPIVLGGAVVDLLIEQPELMGSLSEASILLVDQGQRAGLLGRRYTDYDYLEQAKGLAARYGITLILHGAYPAVCRSSGNVFFCTSGNAALRTPAADVVLAGLLVGLLARGYNVLTASLLACYLVGRAADQYAARYSMESLTASELLRQIPDVFHQLYDRY